MQFDYSPRTRDLQAQVSRFMDEHVYPNEARYEAEIEANTRAGKRWTPLALIEELKPKARAQGLWNLFLPPSAQGAGHRETSAGAGAGLDGGRPGGSSESTALSVSIPDAFENAFRAASSS